MPELYGNFLLCDWKLVNRTPHQIGLPSTDQMRDDRRRTLVTARRSSIGSNSGHDVSIALYTLHFQPTHTELYHTLDSVAIGSTLNSFL